MDERDSRFKMSDSQDEDSQDSQDSQDSSRVRKVASNRTCALLVRLEL